MLELDISNWVAAAKEKLANAPLSAGEALRTRVQELTPVVTGTMRAGWHVEVEADRVLIVNNVVYARRINDGFVGLDSIGRYYDQQGRHMVEQTIAEAPKILGELLK